MDWLQLTTGLLVAGESIALYVGKRRTGWLNPTNQGYVFFDVVIGVLLVASALGALPTQEILVTASILTHLIRDYDHFKNVPDRYAFNLPLLILLNIRLVLLVAILAW